MERAFDPSNMRMHAETKTRQVSKTLQNYERAASASLNGTASGFMADAVEAMTSAHVVGSGRRGAAHVRQDRPCETLGLEPADTALLSKVAKCAERDASGAVALPLFAYNKKQWEKDLCMLAKHRHAQERARDWVAKRPKPRRATRQSSSSSSSSSSTSSSSSSSSAVSGQASDAPTPAVSAVVEAPPAVSAGSSSTGAGAPPAVSAGSSSTGAEELIARPDAQWILPPKGKVHLRVDLGDGSFVVLCQPWRPASAASVTGSGMNTVPQGAKWCAKCMR